jgi:hypothetical protein
MATKRNNKKIMKQKSCEEPQMVSIDILHKTLFGEPLPRLLKL